MVIIEATKDAGIAIKTAFLPFFEQAKAMEVSVKALVVTAEDQKDLMKEAREKRLKLKNIRVQAENIRKEMKEESLRESRAIDGMANIIKYFVVPLEEHLQKQEDYAKNLAEERKVKIYEARKAEVEKLGGDPRIYNLVEIEEPAYARLVETLKKQKAEREELLRQEEKKRVAQEKAAAEEKERLREENKKLKEQAEARRKEEAARRKVWEEEQAELKEKAETEREKREKAEADLKERDNTPQEENQHNTSKTFTETLDGIYTRLWAIHEEGELTIEEDEWLVRKILNEIDDFLGR